MAGSELWRSALFWGALPVFATQGLWVRRRALRLPEAPGAEEGIAGDPEAGPEPLRMIALGDSIVAGVGVTRGDEAWPVRVAHELAARCGRSVRWQRFGRNGADSAELPVQLDRALAVVTRPDLVLVSIGVNDATGFTRLQRFAQALESLRTRLHVASPGSRIVLAAVPPLECFPLLPNPLRHVLGLRAGQLNRLSARWAERHAHIWRTDMPFAPGPERFAEDGFHPHAEACAEWAHYLAERTTERWPELGMPARPSTDPSGGAGASC